MANLSELSDKTYLFKWSIVTDYEKNKHENLFSDQLTSYCF